MYDKETENKFNAEFDYKVVTPHPPVSNAGAKPEVEGTYSETLEKEAADKDRAEQDQKKVTEDALRRKGKELYEHQDVNLGKDNPQGNLNGLSFGRTLALSRAADRYNNKPIDPIVHAHLGKAGAPGTTTSREDPYTRPEIETEETRQMERNRRIDEARQMLRAALQGKVDQWTYDQLSSYFDRLAEINMSDYQFKKLVNQYINQMYVANLMQKDYSTFQDLLKRFGLQADTQAIMRSMRQSPAAANLLMLLTSGTTGLSVDEILSDNDLMRKIAHNVNVLGKDNLDAMLGAGSDQFIKIMSYSPVFREILDKYDY